MIKRIRGLMYEWGPLLMVLTGAAIFLHGVYRG